MWRGVTSSGTVAHASIAHTHVRRSRQPSLPPSLSTVALRNLRCGQRQPTRTFCCAQPSFRCCRRRCRRATARLPTPRPRESSSSDRRNRPAAERHSKRTKPKEPENRRTDPKSEACTPMGCLPALPSPRSSRGPPVRDFRHFGVFVCVRVWQFCVRPANGSSSLSPSPRRRRTRARKCRPVAVRGPASCFSSRTRVKERLLRRHSLGRSNFRRKSPPSYSFLVARMFRVCVRSCPRRRLMNPSRKVRVAEARISESSAE